jgi:hypothetical protein
MCGLIIVEAGFMKIATLLLGMQLTIGGIAYAPNTAPPNQAEISLSSFENISLESPVRDSWRVVNSFDQPNTRFAAGHRGVDLKAEFGETVISPVSGQVSFSGTVGKRRLISITVDHLEIELEPVCSQLKVGEMTAVEDPIGVVCFDSSYLWHCDDPPCLHLGVSGAYGYLNPIWFTKQIEPSQLSLSPGVSPSVAFAKSIY